MALQLRSLVRSNGELELSLHDEPIPEPQAHEVVIRVEASPMNPSDLGLLFGAADMATAKASAAPSARSSPPPCPSARAPRWRAGSTSRCPWATRARARS